MHGEGGMSKMGDGDGGVPDLPFGRRTRWFPLLAAAATLLAAAQGAAQQLTSGEPLDYGTILEWRIVPALIWVAATPHLLDAAPRIRGVTTGWIQAIVAYASLGATWIIFSNLLMRVPAAIRGEALAPLLGDTVRGVVEYGPGAAAVYVGVIAIGLRRTSRQGKLRASRPAGSAANGPRLATDAIPLAIPDGVRIHMVDRSSISWVEADGDHVQVHTAEKSYRTRSTLTAYECELAPDGFLRLHRSALVHPRAIREIQKFYRGDHVAILRDGSEVRIPRTRDGVIQALLRSNREGAGD